MDHEPVVNVADPVARTSDALKFSLLGAIALAAVFSLSAAGANAARMTSANFAATGGHFNAGGSGAMTSTAPVPVFGGAGGTVGEAAAAAPSGSTLTLRTVLPGFWRIFIGGAPSIDLDGDLEQNFLDTDDDGDGLDDLYETGTGVYVSSTDTGSDPLNEDSDDDGLSDGYEVVNGTNPNDPLDPAPRVPALPWLFYTALASGVGALGVRYRMKRVG